MVSPPRTIDWPKVREMFIRRPERPTYAEVGAEFDISEDRVKKTACDEGWAILRAQYIDAQLQKAGAGEIILSALSASKAVVDRGATFGLMALDILAGCVSDAKLANLAASTRSDVIQTCSFAFANIAKGLRELGVVGISKTLDQVGKEQNGQWNPQLLHQINVTVQNLAGKAKAEATETEANAHESG